MERVPTAEELASWDVLRPFMVQPTAVVGAHQNLDVVYEGHFADESVWPKFLAVEREPPANNPMPPTEPAQATDPRR
jgi:hypothetical protein